MQITAPRLAQCTSQPQPVKAPLLRRAAACCMPCALLTQATNWVDLAVFGSRLFFCELVLTRGPLYTEYHMMFKNYIYGMEFSFIIHNF